MDMPMSYYFSITYEDLLFKGVDIKTAWGMLSLCLGILCMSMLSEGFKVARSLLLKVATSQPVNNNTMKTHRNLDKHEDLLYWRRVRFHLLQSVLHVFHLTIGYFLMLLVMTYNAYFTIAVVLGAGFGYYCFSIFDFSGKVLGLTKLSPKRTSRKIEDNGSNRGASQGQCDEQEKAKKTAQLTQYTTNPTSPRYHYMKTMLSTNTNAAVRSVELTPTLV
ncbi:high affinity copper uptake protein 1-like isoform X2 [Oratosquilla oratoria]|uniref:high affinity copper uptake protein 1-like isoform X2 n=1 Tax=Oratosquilla oratoria TaxID=337810 RepID=UPI003F75A65F